MIYSILIMFAQNVFSQNNFGLKLGLNLSQEDKINTTNEIPLIYKAGYGFHLGAFGTYIVNKRVSFDYELIYLKTRISNQAGRTSSFSFLKIPALIGYRPIDRFKVQIGAEIGNLINSNIRDLGTEYENDLFVNKFDFALVLGTIFNISSKYLLSIRYSQNLIPIYSNSWIVYDQDNTTREMIYRVQNSSLQFSIGYKFKS